MTAKKAAKQPLNERTSPAVAKVAGEVLRKGTATPTQAKKLAASALTQTKPKKK